MAFVSYHQIGFRSNDPLDALYERLEGHVDPALLKSAMIEVRSQFGMDKHYIRSVCQDRIAALCDDLKAGIPVSKLTVKYQRTAQQVNYYRRKLGIPVEKRHE